jgi:hypothetical protein
MAKTKKSFKKQQKRAKLLLTGFVILVVLVAGFFTYNYMQNRSSNAESEAEAVVLSGEEERTATRSSASWTVMMQQYGAKIQACKLSPNPRDGGYVKATLTSKPDGVRNWKVRGYFKYVFNGPTTGRFSPDVGNGKTVRFRQKPGQNTPRNSDSFVINLTVDAYGDGRGLVTSRPWADISKC